MVLLAFQMTREQILFGGRKNVESRYRNVREREPDKTLFTDASNEGWGAVLGISSTGGRWLECEKALHINALELRAILFGLKSLCSQFRNVHIRLRADNTTAVAYINNMGGIKSVDCDRCAREIWLWCFDRDIWISAEHLPGSENVLADRESRVFHDETEWMLSSLVFEKLTQLLGKVDIDLFASRLNKQCEKYISWKPDPYAHFVNAFDCCWGNLNFYAFSPFSLISRVLAKILKDEAAGIVVVPLWTTQLWFPRLLKMIAAKPVVLPLNVLSLPYREGFHPLHKKLRLMACRVSGNLSDVRDYRKTLPTCS